jgi:hypothetical protein
LPLIESARCPDSHSSFCACCSWLGSKVRACKRECPQVEGETVRVRGRIRGAQGAAQVARWVERGPPMPTRRLEPSRERGHSLTPSGGPSRVADGPQQSPARDGPGHGERRSLAARKNTPARGAPASISNRTRALQICSRWPCRRSSAATGGPADNRGRGPYGRSSEKHHSSRSPLIESAPCRRAPCAARLVSC